MVPRFLIVAATAPEIEPLLKHFVISFSGNDGLLTDAGGTFSVLLTGVGMVNTAYRLGGCSDTGFDYVINAGICGAFDRRLSLGEVVHVVSDTLSEMGAENDADFIPYPELGLGGTNVYQATELDRTEGLTTLRQVKGITVNKVHGNAASIRHALALFAPEVETMEGAAFFRGSEHFRGSRLQVRAVSNYVEKRDKSTWKIQLAIQNLNDFLIQYLHLLKP